MFVFVKLVLFFSVLHFCECDYKTNIGCENDRIYLKCRRNQIITIQSVFYGRELKRVCPNQYADRYVRISSPRCINHVSQKCNNRKSCRIKVENSACGERSNWYSETRKHMEIKYKCCDVNHPGSHEHPPPPHIDCAPFREVKYNVSSCQPRCPSSRNIRHRCYIIKGPSCVCRKGFVLDEKSNNCVAKNRCPYYNPHDPSETTPERFVQCGYCDQCTEHCHRPTKCTKECKPPGYYCKVDHCRNKNNKCIKCLSK